MGWLQFGIDADFQKNPGRRRQRVGEFCSLSHLRGSRRAADARMFRGSQPAACRTRDGRLWFPTIKGLAYVNPAELKPNLQPPLVMIESVLVDGPEQKPTGFDSAWQQSVTIPPGGEGWKFITPP
jgi:hypothetical protein